MKLYVVDAFTTRKFSGNQAGVALLGRDEDYPDDGFMQTLAAELKHSETVFVKRLGPESVRLRYFTPGRGGSVRARHHCGVYRAAGGGKPGPRHLWRLYAGG